MTLETAGHLTVKLGGEAAAVPILSTMKQSLHIRHAVDKILFFIVSLIHAKLSIYA